MKKVFIIFLLAISGQPLFGQETPKFVYCEVLGFEKLLSTKVTIQVEFGQKLKMFADNRMKDENGKPIVFNSMIDALNFMGKQGWEFVQAYVVTISQQNYYHYLMKKPYAELDEEAKKEYMKD